MAAPPRAAWRAFGRRYLVALGVALLLVTTAIVAVNVRIDQTLAGIRRVEGLDLADAGPAEAGNFLIIGSDSRDFVANEAEAEAFGTNEDTGGPRSDTMMVVHVDPEADRSILVSFPRDLLVDIPGQGRGQINSAFNSGSPQLVIDTLQQNFDLPIHHYVQVDFQAFVGIVDAVGRIPVYFEAPARDTVTGFNVPFAPGCVELDGNQALQFVRSRYLEVLDAETGEWTDASPRSDLDRITRQQSFIRRLAAVAADKASGNPLRAQELAEAIVPELRVDENLSNDDIFALVNEFRKADPEQSIEMLTLPVEAASDGNRLVAMQPEAEEVLARLRTFGPTPDASDLDVRPNQVTLRVLNGSGVDGQAGSTIAELQQYGFRPAGTGNASRRAATEVRYRPGAGDAEQKALLVQSFLSGGAKLIADDSIIDADVVVVTGDDFGGVVTPKGFDEPAPSSAPTTSSTVPLSAGEEGQPAPAPIPTC